MREVTAGSRDETDFSKESTPSTTPEVYVHVVVFTADGFLYERLLHYIPIDDYRIAIFSQCNLWGDLITTEDQS